MPLIDEFAGMGNWMSNLISKTLARRRSSIIDHEVMTHTWLAATNSLAAQNNVILMQGKNAKVADGIVNMNLPPRSYQMLQLVLAK